MRSGWKPLAGLIAVCLAAAPLPAQQEQDEVRRVEGAAAADLRAQQQVPEELSRATSLWEDYIHYLRVAQIELSNSAGAAFLELELTPGQTLRVVEELSPYRDYAQTLLRAQRMEQEGVADLAARVTAALREARLAVAREGRRIRAAIDRLDDGLRARLNAQEELTEAGQYAAPQLLEVLLSPAEADRALRPYVLEAMVVAGRPLAGPLSEALGHLPAVPKQQVAEVLGRIGYPLALPYLKAELERGDLAAPTQAALQAAFDRIVELTGAPSRTDAANLFLFLAEDYYGQRESLILEPNEPHNLMWTYASGAGLTPLRVPTPVYHDAMAMRATRRSLQLNPNLAASMSLWLAANFRRENNLPAGAEDPSYGPEMRSPHFYATLFGPRHLHPVLHRALEEQNAPLALDAIRALRTTSGTHSLLNLDGRTQPLIAALKYPDRRVRFEAAFAIARSVPRTDFSGAQRVAPVLAEAVREGSKLYAGIIAPSTEVVNSTTPFVGAAGNYQMLIGDSVETMDGQFADAPGVDVLVVNASLAEAEAAVASARRHFKLMGTPILVLADASEVPTAGRLLGTQPGVFVANRQAPTEQLTQAVVSAAGWDDGADLSDAQSQGYAITALDILHDLTIESAEIFNPQDAQPALIEALGDPRDPVVLGAADVLARFPGAEPQRALARAALNPQRGEPMQVALLRGLATSARAFGNQLTDAQLDNLLGVVAATPPGPLADAAAEVHGALNLPTANAVDLVTQ